MWKRISRNGTQTFFKIYSDAKKCRVYTQVLKNMYDHIQNGFRKDQETNERVVQEHPEQQEEYKQNEDGVLWRQGVFRSICILRVPTFF